MAVTSEEWLLASSKWRRGMLLKIIQCTGQPPITKNYLVQNVYNAKVEKPWVGEFISN